MPEGSDETVEFRTASETVQLPAVAEGSGLPANIGLIFLAVAAASFLVGVAIASFGRPGSSGVVVANEVVGPAGETVRFTGGEIRIPPRALSEPVRLIVRRSTERRVRVRVPGAPRRVLETVAYDFQPGDLGFRRPVRLVFRLPGGDRNGAVAIGRGGSTVVLESDVDGRNGTVTTEIRSFRFG